MATPVEIIDTQTGGRAKVSEFGQLIVAPIAYSTAEEREMDTINTAFNFVIPEHGKSIVITDIIASADNSVSNTAPADIVVYQSDSATSLVSLSGIVRPQLVRANNFILNGLNLIIPEGRWINATTTDNDILLTIMFYRVPV